MRLLAFLSANTHQKRSHFKERRERERDGEIVFFINKFISQNLIILIVYKVYINHIDFLQDLQIRMQIRNLLKIDARQAVTINSYNLI